jgi:hypothetical protein
MMNFLISIFGWLAWNFSILSIDKDKYDTTGKAFPLKEYAHKHWDNWIGSLITIPLLLYIGYRGLDLNPLSAIDLHTVGWNDLYYMCSGFAFEAIKYAIGKTQNIFKKQ